MSINRLSTMFVVYIVHFLCELGDANFMDYSGTPVFRFIFIKKKSQIESLHFLSTQNFSGVHEQKKTV